MGLTEVQEARTLVHRGISHILLAFRYIVCEWMILRGSVFVGND